MESSKSERCTHGHHAPTAALRKLPEDTAPLQSKCAVCAYAAGASAGARRGAGPVDVDKTCEAIRDQLDLLQRSRVALPHFDEAAVGGRVFKSAPSFAARGLAVQFEFPKGLTESQRRKFHEIGHWINQNFVLRLYSVLESGKVVGRYIDIDHSLTGSEHVDTVRLLRNVFSHGTGRYNSKRSEHRELRARLLKSFQLDADEYPESWFPLPVEGVLMKLGKGCELYVRALGKKLASV